MGEYDIIILTNFTNGVIYRMRKLNLPFLLATVALLAVLFFISYGAPNTVDTKTYQPAVYSTIFSLLPPVIAIGLALITK